MDCGLVVLRTPLLPVEAYRTWARQTESALLNADLKTGEAYRLLLETMRGTASDPVFREALSLASVALCDQVDAWLAGDGRVDHKRLLFSLARYFSRATYRCTPFALFAGCSTVGIADHSFLELSPRSHFSRRSRIDMGHLAELVRTIASRSDCRKRLHVRANSSLSTLGGRLHYVESRSHARRRIYMLAAADLTLEVEKTLARARGGASYQDLALPLIADGFDETEVDLFLDELFDSQLLVSDIGPLISGANATKVLADSLDAAGCAHEVTVALRSVLASLDAIDSQEIFGRADYKNALAPLRSLEVPVDESQILQVDLYKPAPSAVVSRRVIDSAIDASQLLLSICIKLDPLAGFIHRFEKRYETRAVPLLEALDDEIGVGLPAIADDAALKRHTDAQLKREPVFGDLRCRAARSGTMEVQLSDEDVSRLRTNAARGIANSFSFFGSIVASSAVAIDRGDYLLVARSINGPSGARLLGRFGHLDTTFEKQLQDYCSAEEACEPLVVFAEIVHLPQGRLGNVLARPSLRRYEIPYLASSAKKGDDRIEVADLMVAVRNGRVSLFSSRLKREVRPRLSTAHNYSALHELPVYRFLCLLQDHQELGSAAWTWGAQSSAEFLPRVSRGRLVLSPAMWRLDDRDFRVLADASRSSDVMAVDSWRNARGIPSFVLYSQADNQLPVDFANAVSALMFAQLAKSQKSGMLIESVHGADGYCVTDEDGHYACEIIVPLIQVRPDVPDKAGTKLMDNFANDRAKREYPPGSEWLYAKIYCGKGIADKLLREVISPLVSKVRSEFSLKGWFFIRYMDPEPHIRLRMNVGKDAVPQVFTLLTEATSSELTTGRIAKLVYDTYLPEVERYGGGSSIELVESLFSADSDAVLDALSASTSQPTDFQLVALMGVDSLLSDAYVSLPDRILLLEQWLGEVSVDLRRRRSVAFRAQRARIAAALSATTEHAEFGKVRSVLDRRSASFMPTLARLRDLASAGQLCTSYREILLSLCHMWVNRVIPDGVAAERGIYDQLLRSYRSTTGRAIFESSTRADPSGRERI